MGPRSALPLLEAAASVLIQPALPRRASVSYTRVLVVGVIYLAVLTRGFRRRPPEMHPDNTDATDQRKPLPES